MNTNDILEFLDIRKGRLHRTGYFICAIILSAITDLTEIIFDHSILLLLLLSYSIAVLTARRLRDINFSGWFVLPIVILSFITSVAGEFYKLNKKSYFLDPITMDYILWTLVISVILVQILLFFVPPYKKTGKYSNHPEMTTKSVSTEINKNKILAQYTLIGGLKLFKNDQLLAHKKNLFTASAKNPMLTEKIIIDGNEYLIEVFVSTIVFWTKIQIRINGEKTIGDYF